MPEKSQEIPAELMRELGPLPPARATVPFTVRAIAAIQGLGALLGLYALIATLTELQVFDCLPLVALASVLWFAVGVWRGDARAMQRMQWVMAAQIPWLNLPSPGVHYNVYFVVACILRVGNADEPLELGIGTAVNAYPGALPNSAFLGVNLAAVALLVMFRSGSKPWRLPLNALPR
jgi:hypothetical protein